MKYCYNKYHARKTVVNGIKFDSAAEAERYQELLLLQRAGTIKDLQRQRQYQLIPAQKLETPRVYADGHRRLMESAVVYVADYVYTDVATGKTVVEDVKGMARPEYVLKRKLMKYLLNIEIHEVYV